MKSHTHKSLALTVWRPTQTGGWVGFAHRRFGNIGFVPFAIINQRFETARLGNEQRPPVHTLAVLGCPIPS